MSIQSEITRISDAKSTLSTWLTEQNVETEEGANLTSIAETISGLSLGGGITEIYGDFDITTLDTGIYDVAEGVVMTTYDGSGETETITWDDGCLLTIFQFTNSDTGLGESEQWNWKAFAVHTGSSDIFQYYGIVVKITSYDMSMNIGQYTQINTNNIVVSDNLKTVNGNSLIGTGDITIEGGSSGGSAITELTSPIRLWDLEEGFYKIPSGSTVYYYGTTNTTSKISLAGGAILTIANYNDTTKRFTIFCGSNTDKQFVLGHTTSTGGSYQVFDMNNLKAPTFSSASYVLGYTYNTYQNTSNLNGTSELSPGVYARKVNASTTGIPTGITEEAHVVIETKNAFPGANATYPNIRQDLYALSLNKHWYRMINYASSSSITYGEWEEIIESGASFTPTAYNVTGSATSVATATNKTIATLKVPAGMYMFYGFVNFGSNSTGVRKISIATSTDTVANTRGITDTRMASNNSSTMSNISTVLIPSDETTYYLNVYQNSGSTLTCYGSLRAVRIGDYAEYQAGL